MAKKPKGKAKPSKVDDQATTEATCSETCEVVSVAQPEVIEETIIPHPAVENIGVVVVIEPKQTEDTHSIEHVAHQVIIGMRDEWLPSIRTRAALMGIPPTSEQTVATWKNVFKAWGGNNILKP